MVRRIVGPRKDAPYLTKQEIAAEAALLFDQYRLAHPDVAVPPVPVDEIVELQLKLVLEFKDMRALFQVGDVHGAIWFRTKTVGIDRDLDPGVNPRKLGRYRFTLGHEAGHWWLHRQFYLDNPSQTALFSDGTPHPDVVCRSSEAKKPVEWQADFFAANLLMPRDLVRAAWQKWRGDLEAVVLADLRQGEAPTGQASVDNAILEGFCRPLAEQFEVSPEAMRIRLEELEFLLRVKDEGLFGR